MHDAMPDRRRHGEFAVGEKPSDPSDGVFLAGKGRGFGNQAGA